MLIRKIKQSFLVFDTVTTIKFEPLNHYDDGFIFK